MQGDEKDHSVGREEQIRQDTQAYLRDRERCA